MPEVSNEFYNQVYDSVKLVLDLTGRIDERVKLLIEQHQDVNARIEKLMERQESLFNRLAVLEAAEKKNDLDLTQRDVKAIELKVNALEILNQGHASRWDKTLDWLLKFLFAILSAALLWKLGIKQ